MSRAGTRTPQWTGSSRRGLHDDSRASTWARSSDGSNLDVARRCRLWCWRQRRGDGRQRSLRLSPINVQPVSGNCALRIEQTHRPCAHLIVQIVLNLMLLVETWPWFGCLGQIRDVVATACLERHVVIDFIFTVVRSTMPYSRYTSRLTSAGTFRTDEL